MADIFCIRIYICKKYFFQPLFTIVEMEDKRKISFIFGLRLPLDLINLLNIM